MPTRGFSVFPASFLPSPTAVMFRSHDGLAVCSSVDVMNLPGTDDTETGPTWLVTVSRNGGRATDDDLRRVIECFEMPAHDEDNHQPGIARALFCPVEERYRNACECKLTELLVTEPDGYQWTTDPAEECRGCTYEKMVAALGKTAPCPLHTAG